MAERDILKMPGPAKVGAPRRLIWKSRFVEFVGCFLNKVGIPGAIGDVSIEDEVTGQHIQVRTGRFFTRLSVNGRDYYFQRLSGRFDVTGMGCG